MLKLVPVFNGHPKVLGKSCWCHQPMLTLLHDAKPEESQDKEVEQESTTETGTVLFLTRQYQPNQCKHWPRYFSYRQITQSEEGKTLRGQKVKKCGEKFILSNKAAVRANLQSTCLFLRTETALISQLMYWVCCLSQSVWVCWLKLSCSSIKGLWGGTSFEHGRSQDCHGGSKLGLLKWNSFYTNIERCKDIYYYSGRLIYLVVWQETS